jgi:hypothetical protein
MVFCAASSGAMVFASHPRRHEIDQSRASSLFNAIFGIEGCQAHANVLADGADGLGIGSIQRVAHEGGTQAVAGPIVGVLFHDLGGLMNHGLGSEDGVGGKLLDPLPSLFGVAGTRWHYGISAGQAVLRVVLPLLVASMRAVGRTFRARYDYGRLHRQALPPTLVLGAADDDFLA